MERTSNSCYFQYSQKKQSIMKKLTCIITSLLLLSQIIAVNAQQQSAFSKLSAAEFEKLIFKQHRISSDKDSSLYQEIINRLKSEKYISDEAILGFISKISHRDNLQYIGTIDTILSYCPYRPYLQLSLLGCKATAFRLSDIVSDSVKLSTFSRIDVLGDITLQLTRIQYQNYVDLGYYYYSLRDREKAVYYYEKGRGAQYYNYYQKDEGRFFYDIYVSSSLGLIRSIGPNYAKLKDLIFIPSALVDICPELSAAMINAGGQCKLCEGIMSQLRLIHRYSIPPVVDTDEH